MTSQEMMKVALKPEHIWCNVAALGCDPDWCQIPKPVDFDLAGNPNSHIYEPKLFGYSEKQFLAKQYK